MSLKIVGICRFSLLGRGDWKATTGKSDIDLVDVLEERAKTLFMPQRMAERFSTFEHLTLKSIASQSDKDFIFLVCASDQMPLEYRQRLDKITANISQVVVRYYPATDVISAQDSFFREAEIDYRDCVQFRLDDDDCVFVRYIDRLRFYAEQLRAVKAFGMSFPDLIYSSINGKESNVYLWHRAFFSAGAAVRHPSRSIYSYGHFAIPRRLPSLIIPYFTSLVTHRGNNDTQPIHLHPAARREMSRIDPAKLRDHIAEHLPFLDDNALRIAGLL